jgi:hypothetical protein
LSKPRGRLVLPDSISPKSKHLIARKARIGEGRSGEGRRKEGRRRGVERLQQPPTCS